MHTDLSPPPVWVVVNVLLLPSSTLLPTPGEPFISIRVLCIRLRLTRGLTEIVPVRLTARTYHAFNVSAIRPASRSQLHFYALRMPVWSLSFIVVFHRRFSLFITSMLYL